MKPVSILFYLVVIGSLATPDLGAQPLSERIRSVMNRGHNPKIQFSIQFYDMVSRHSVFESNADRPQKPASNMKLVTTAATLDILGGDFAYETHYGLLGQDLVVVGAGDPLLGDPVVAQRRGTDIFEILRQVAAALKEKGINAIRGNLLLDDFIFDNERFHPSWPSEQADKWYTAQVSGLSFNDNCIDFLFVPGSAPGQPAGYTMVPQTAFVKIVNNCKTVGASQKTAVGIMRKQDSNDLTLIGACGNALASPVSVTVDNPSAYHGFVLAEYLHRQGIGIDGELVIRRVLDENGRLPDGFQPLVTIRTPITDVLRESNQRSLNLVAECLIKTLGACRDRSGRGPSQVGSWAGGQAVILDFLQRAGLQTEGLVIDDGSGLSHKNRISAHAMALLLHYMDKSPHAQAFRESLATAENGTLSKRDRFSESKYAGKVFAKTGYINGANTLSGYCQTQSGKHLAFSVLTQSPAASNSDIDAIVKLVMDHY